MTQIGPVFDLYLTGSQVPDPCPAAAMAAAGRRLRVTAGYFKSLYGPGGPAARKFDCVLTRPLSPGGVYIYIYYIEI